jgi:hypothetical protein
MGKVYLRGAIWDLCTGHFTSTRSPDLPLTFFETDVVGTDDGLLLLSFEPGDVVQSVRFDAVANRWTVLAKHPLPGLGEHGAFRLGSHVVLLSWTARARSQAVRGALLDLTTGRWTRLPASPLMRGPIDLVSEGDTMGIAAAGKVSWLNAKRWRWSGVARLPRAARPARLDGYARLFGPPADHTSAKWKPAPAVAPAGNPRAARAAPKPAVPEPQATGSSAVRLTYELVGPTYKVTLVQSFWATPNDPCPPPARDDLRPRLGCDPEPGPPGMEQHSDLRGTFEFLPSPLAP